MVNNCYLVLIKLVYGGNLVWVVIVVGCLVFVVFDFLVSINFLGFFDFVI